MTQKILTLAILLFFSSNVYSQSCIDSDGDGWGWDGTKSCKVTTSANICIDHDGDGWGWDGVKSCQTDNSESSNMPCIDSDGDGWGWDGTKSCRATTIEPDCLPSGSYNAIPSRGVDSCTNNNGHNSGNHTSNNPTEDIAFEPLTTLNISLTNKPVPLGCGFPKIPPGGIWTKDGFKEYTSASGITTSDGYIYFDRGRPFGVSESEYERTLPQRPSFFSTSGYSLSNICKTFELEGALVSNYAFKVRKKFINKGTNIEPSALAQIISGRINYWSYLRDKMSHGSASVSELRELKRLSLWIARDMLGPDYQRVELTGVIEVFNLLRRSPLDKNILYNGYSIGVGVDRTPFSYLWSTSSKSLKLRYLNIPEKLWEASSPFVSVAKTANTRLVELNPEAQTVKIIFHVGASIALGSLFQDAWIHYFGEQAFLSNLLIGPSKELFIDTALTGRIPSGFAEYFNPFRNIREAFTPQQIIINYLPSSAINSGGIPPE